MEMIYSWNGRWDDIEIMEIPVSVEDESVDDEYNAVLYKYIQNLHKTGKKNGIT